MRLGCVYGGCLLIFFCGFCAMGYIAIFADFFLPYFFGFVSVVVSSTETNRCICISVFCILHFVVNENPLLTSCFNCCPATPPAPLACWGRAGMAYPDLKV